MNILQAIEQTPYPASADNTVKSTDAEAVVVTEGEDLIATMSEIDKIISDVAVEKEVAKEVSHKGKRLRKSLRKKQTLTYDTWMANNFPKRIWQS